MASAGWPDSSTVLLARSERSIFRSPWRLARICPSRVTGHPTRLCSAAKVGAHGLGGVIGRARPVGNPSRWKGLRRSASVSPRLCSYWSPSSRTCCPLCSKPHRRPTCFSASPSNPCNALLPA